MSDSKVCLITGATSGIGTATAGALAKQGWEVYIHGRSRTKLDETRDQLVQESGNEGIHCLQADLSKLDDVRGLAQQFLDLGKPLDCLISNAGVTNTNAITTADGYEEMFAVNHLAPFLLTNLLLDKVKESDYARIVVVSSGAHAFCKGIQFDDLSFTKNFSSMKVYGHSKLANILFTRELAKRLAGSGVTVNTCHPGAVATGLGTNNGWLGKLAMGVVKPFFRSPLKGAESSIYLATSNEVDSVSGEYFYNCKIEATKPWATDMDQARQLWRVSEEMTGLKA